MFKLEHLSWVHQSLRRSEELVSHHFRIPALPSTQYPYEIVTLVDLHGPERAPDAFAHLVIYERERPKGMEHLYRICLQDDVILQRLEKTDPSLLRELLWYIFTHELIHVVRFQRAEQSFSIQGLLRDKEEDLVHDSTLELLQSVGDPKLLFISRLFGNPVLPPHRVRLPITSALNHLSSNSSYPNNQNPQLSPMRP